MKQSYRRNGGDEDVRAAPGGLGSFFQKGDNVRDRLSVEAELLRRMHVENFHRLSGFDFGFWDGLEKAAHALDDHRLKGVCFSRWPHGRDRGERVWENRGAEEV
jgi:hypothetical protein